VVALEAVGALIIRPFATRQDLSQGVPLRAIGEKSSRY
jgi:hypothetical protein